MALTTSNLKLYDVSMALGEGNYNISMYNIFTSGSINAEGLDPNYCPGATPAARLTNLQTAPYVLGKFRGYDHAAGGSLNAILTSTTNNTSPCNTIYTAATVYSNQTTIALAYSNGQGIYSDSAGNTNASSGWYSEDEVNWYYWDGSQGRWGNYQLCQSVTQVSASGPETSSVAACLGGKSDTYYHDGQNAVPVAGDSVYTDAALSNPASAGYYKAENYTDWWQIGSNGLVLQNGKCS
jgi:hypothetical protein